MASAFALQRLRRKPLPELPGAFPEVPDQEILEEEEEEIPLLDSPDRDGPKRSDGDGESTDSEDCNYRSSTNILQNLERANQSILELGNMVQQQQMQLAQCNNRPMWHTTNVV